MRVRSGERTPVRPYVDEPVRDTAAATVAARTAADRWHLPPAELWRIGMNAIFLAGHAVIRVGLPTASAAASVRLHAALGRAGIKVPLALDVEPLRIGPYTVTGWERLDTSASPISWESVGALIARLHELDPGELPTDYPIADPLAFPWWDFPRMLTELGPHLDEPARAGLHAAVERGKDWVDFPPGATVVCHGDVHPGNVVNTLEGPTLIDWDLMCRAPRGWDHGPLMTWHERWGGERIYDAFAAGYGWSGRDDGFSEAVAELRLVAATLMRVRAGLTDPNAQAEVENRLRYWRGERDAPAWTAQ